MAGPTRSQVGLPSVPCGVNFEQIPLFYPRGWEQPLRLLSPDSDDSAGPWPRHPGPSRSPGPWRPRRAAMVTVTGKPASLTRPGRAGRDSSNGTDPELFLNSIVGVPASRVIAMIPYKYDSLQVEPPQPGHSNTACRIVAWLEYYVTVTPAMTQTMRTASLVLPRASD